MIAVESKRVCIRKNNSKRKKQGKQKEMEIYFFEINSGIFYKLLFQFINIDITQNAEPICEHINFEYLILFVHYYQFIGRKYALPPLTLLEIRWLPLYKQIAWSQY